MNNNKYDIVVDNVSYTVDDISFEYSQLDGDDAGRSDDGTMYRDVIGMVNKISCDFKDSTKWKGATLTNILQLVKKKSCSFNYFDPMANSRVTKTVYVKADQIQVYLIEDTFYAKPFQIRFIQMDTDNI